MLADRAAMGVALICLGLSPGVVLAQGPEIPPLRPPHGELRLSFWELHGWQCAIGAAVVLGMLALGILWLRRPRVVVAEPPGVLARRALEPLRGRLEDGGLAAEVSRILRRYVIAALQLPPDELTTTELRKTLQSQPRINPDLAAAIGDFLRRCDEWKFAAAPPAPQLCAVPGALELVERIEQYRQPVSSTEAAVRAG